MTAHAPCLTRTASARLTRETRTELTSALLHQASGADESERRELQTRVVELHLDVAESVAFRYWGRGQDHEDLVQVARLGLVEAVQRFNPDRGPFLAFAIPTMLGQVKRHFRDHSWFVRPPRPIQERLHEITQARNDLTQSLHRQPTTAEIASHLNLTEQDVRVAGDTHSCFHPTSLDAPASGSSTGYSHADLLGDDQSAIDEIETLATISPACLQLAPADRQILFLRFFLQHTQDEIASELGMSQMQVSRRLRRILTHLRAAIGDLDAPRADNQSRPPQPDAVTPAGHVQDVPAHDIAA